MVRERCGACFRKWPGERTLAQALAKPVIFCTDLDTLPFHFLLHTS